MENIIEDLNIKNGETKVMPARTYKFSSITIERGCSLKVQYKLLM